MLFFLKCEWFRNQSLVMVVWGAALLVWYGFYLRVVVGVPFGSNPGPDWMVWVLLVALASVCPLFLLLRLEVGVRGDCLSYRMYPIHLQFWEVGRHEIVAVEAISYRPLWESMVVRASGGKRQGLPMLFQGILGSGSPSWVARPFSSGHSGRTSLLLRFPVVFLKTENFLSGRINM